MIKIERVTGTGTVVRDGTEIGVFPSMIIYAEEVASLKTTGEIQYSVDEQELVTVTATPPQKAKE